MILRAKKMKSIHVAPHTKYGHYCDKARRMRVEPATFAIFKKEYDKDIYASMRSIVYKLEHDKQKGA
jgi:hypothetical protein